MLEPGLDADAVAEKNPAVAVLARESETAMERVGCIGRRSGPFWPC